MGKHETLWLVMGALAVSTVLALSITQDGWRIRTRPEQTPSDLLCGQHDHDMFARRLRVAEEKLDAHLNDPAFLEWLNAHHHREEQRLDVLENMVAGLRANPIKRQPVCLNGALGLDGRACVNGEWQQLFPNSSPQPNDVTLYGYECSRLETGKYKCKAVR